LIQITCNAGILERELHYGTGRWRMSSIEDRREEMNMKKIVAMGILAGVMSVSLQAGCVVRARAVVPVPAVTVHYRVVSGRRVLVVPPSVAPGHVVIINGQRCVVKKRRHNRIKVVYPSGRVAWVDVVSR